MENFEKKKNLTEPNLTWKNEKKSWKTGKKLWKNEKKNCEKPIREMPFWQLVFGKYLSESVHFGKKYSREMSIQGHAFYILTMNPLLLYIHCNN